MAIYEIAASTTTTATPQQVWAVLDDFSGWPGWMPSMQNLKVELLTPGPLVRGYRFRLRGKIAYADLQVTSYAPLERATRFQLNFPPLTGANRCLITPLGAGRFRLDRVDQINLFGPLIGLIDATQRARFTLLANEFLESLKHAVEQRARHAIS